MDLISELCEIQGIVFSTFGHEYYISMLQADKVDGKKKYYIIYYS